MFLSVIIPTCNRNDLLKKCLERLSSRFQNLQSEDYEVIVTDDSATHAARDFMHAEFSRFVWLKGPGKGPAANRNNGANHAKGDWLIFIDDDCLPDKDILSNYKMGIANYPAFEAFEGAIIPDDWDLMKRDLSECPINTEGNAFWSANVCIKASLFKKVNGFDESYLLAAQEDQQMKLDIETASPVGIKFLRECVVVHPVRFSTLKKQVNKIHKVSKNFLIYALKNRQTLGYSTPLNFAASQFKLHLRNTYQTIKGGKLKASIVAMIWLVYGVPLNIVNYYRVRGKY